MGLLHYGILEDLKFGTHIIFFFPFQLDFLWGCFQLGMWPLIIQSKGTSGEVSDEGKLLKWLLKLEGWDELGDWNYIYTLLYIKEITNN